MSDTRGIINLGADVNSRTREIVFISKATPEDDDFVLWLAPRLEAAGHTVFADILTLEPGDRWRKEITNTLQNNAVKMLLCCRDATLNKTGVQEEVGIASDLVKELKDARFIIPLRLEVFKKLFGIGELPYPSGESHPVRRSDFVLKWGMRGERAVMAGSGLSEAEWRRWCVSLSRAG